MLLGLARPEAVLNLAGRVRPRRRYLAGEAVQEARAQAERRSQRARGVNALLVVVLRGGGVVAF